MYQPIRPRQAVDLILQRKTPFGARIFVPLDESPQVIPLIDPEVGDLMYIVPIFRWAKACPIRVRLLTPVFCKRRRAWLLFLISKT